MKLVRLAFLAAICGVPLAAHALTFNFSLVVSGGTPDGPAPWATLVITDSGVNTVDFALTNNAPGTSSQFITELDLNIDPYPSSFTSFAVLSDPDLLVTGMALSQDSINGLSGENFDFEIDFKKSGSGPRFTSGKTVTWQLAGAGLSAAAFDSLSVNGTDPKKALLHIQGLADGSSSKLSPVPEPTTLALLGLGVLGLARRRR